MGRHVSTVVEQLKAGKIIGKDIKIIPITIAKNAATKTQARKERHGEFQEDVLGFNIHAICPNPSPGARPKDRYEVASHITAIFRAATKAYITDFHAVMHPQELAGAEVPIQA